MRTAQDDLSFRLAHSHFVGFVMSRLILPWFQFLTALDFNKITLQDTAFQ